MAVHGSWEQSIDSIHIIQKLKYKRDYYVNLKRKNMFIERLKPNKFNRGQSSGSSKSMSFWRPRLLFNYEGLRKKEKSLKLNLDRDAYRLEMRVALRIESTNFALKGDV